jgi:hypothetical protein
MLCDKDAVVSKESKAAAASEAKKDGSKPGQVDSGFRGPGSCGYMAPEVRVAVLNPTQADANDLAAKFPAEVFSIALTMLSGILRCTDAHLLVSLVLQLWVPSRAVHYSRQEVCSSGACIASSVLSANDLLRQMICLHVGGSTHFLHILLPTWQHCCVMCCCCAPWQEVLSSMKPAAEGQPSPFQQLAKALGMPELLLKLMAELLQLDPEHRPTAKQLLNSPLLRPDFLTRAVYKYQLAAMGQEDSDAGYDAFLASFCCCRPERVALVLGTAPREWGLGAHGHCRLISQIYAGRSRSRRLCCQHVCRSVVGYV